MNFGLIALALVLLAFGCATISAEDAEGIALDYLSERGKFFTVDENQTKTVADYTFDVVEVRQGSQFEVIVNVSSEIVNTTKSAVVAVIVSRSGEIMNVYNAKTAS